MKALLLTLLTIALTACGYSQRDTEVIGQPKRIHNVTPIVCSNWKALDLSLGVVRNGIGSMSSEDIDLVIQDNDQLKTIKQAIDNGNLIKITYDDARLRFCQETREITKVEIVK